MTELTRMLWLAEPLACLAALMLVFKAKQIRRYAAFSAYLAVHAFSTTVLFSLYRYHALLALDGQTAYRLYFYSFWLFYVVESAAIFFVILGLFKLAMEPLKGLQWMGGLVFRWAAFASILVAVGSAIAPHTSSSAVLLTAAGLFQRGESILVLCLLAFLVIAGKPLKLDPTNRVFGVCLGFGVMATIDLLQSAFMTQSSPMLSTSLNVIRGVAVVCSFMIWIAYFAFPEPKLKLITLPIKSPLLVWNDIAEALGTATPHVALNASPEIFAEGELEMIRMSMTTVEQAS